MRRVPDCPEPHPRIAAGCRSRGVGRPPGLEMVAAAHGVEPSLLCCDRLCEQIVGLVPLVGERNAIGNFLRLPLTGPQDAANGLDDARHGCNSTFTDPSSFLVELSKSR